MHKLLILDGIGGIPLGLEIHEAFQHIGIDADYCNLAMLPEIPLYRLRSIYAKARNKQQNNDGFFHLPRIQRAAIEALIRKQRPTHILVIGFAYKFVDPGWLQQLARQSGSTLYLYDTDSCNLYAKRREFLFFLEHELPAYQAVFSFSQVTTQFFRQTRKLNAHYLPFGAKPIRLPSPSGREHEVLFVGSGDLRRVFLLEHVKQHVAIFGNRWQRNYPLVSDVLRSRIEDSSVWGAELHQLLADSHIVLNITRTDFYGAETGVNLRIFEALAAGKFLLTDYCDEVAELFEIGREIETFKGSKELAEKVEFYLANPEKRQAIAAAGHQRYLAEFTWQARMQILADQIGLARSS